MRPSRGRIAAFGLALIVCWSLLLLFVAGTDWRTPPWSDGGRAFPGSNFRPAKGHAEIDGQQLRVTAADEGDTALQVVPVPELEAARFPLLSYEFSDMPRTLELSFMFRRVDGTDVESIAVPAAAGTRTVTVDLSRVPAWQGRISEIGFAQFPVAQLAAPADAFHPFTLVKVKLHPASWLGRLRALASAWTARSPWQLISISALGPGEIGDRTPHPLHPPLVVALALGIAIVLARLILRLRGRALARGALLGLALGWLALDLCWLRDLDYKRRVDRSAWGDTPLAQRQERVADADLAMAAAELKTLLAGEPPTRHVLLSTRSPYSALRLMYHAAPLNMSFASALPESLATGLVPGTIIVRYRMPGALVGQSLLFDRRVVRVQTLRQDARLSVYRVVAVKP